MDLGEAVRGRLLVVEKVGGERGFRRRLMELGLVPGTRVELVGVAPLGDPLELLVRGCSLSIRRREAEHVRVSARGTTGLHTATVAPVAGDALEAAGSGC